MDEYYVLHIRVEKVRERINPKPPVVQTDYTVLNSKTFTFQEQNFYDVIDRGTDLLESLQEN